MALRATAKSAVQRSRLHTRHSIETFGRGGPPPTRLDSKLRMLLAMRLIQKARKLALKRIKVRTQIASSYGVSGTDSANMVSLKSLFRI